MPEKITIDNRKVFYNITGSGPTVVLIHGFGEDSRVWDEQISFLKNKFRLIVPDLPGSGKSEMVKDMSMEGMAEIIKQILDETLLSNTTSSLTVDTNNLGSDGVQRVCIIGHSMGGYITLAFAEKYQGFLNGFGLFHSSAYPDNDEKKEIRRKGIEFIHEHGAYEFLKSSIPNLFSAFTKEQQPELVNDHIARGSNFSESALVSYFESMMHRPDRVAILKDAQIPVLFIIGEHDTAVPLGDSLKLCIMPENAYIHLLPNSGHMGMYEEADRSNHILEEYLNDIFNFTSTLIE